MSHPSDAVHQNTCTEELFRLDEQRGASWATPTPRMTIIREMTGGVKAKKKPSLLLQCSQKGKLCVAALKQLCLFSPVTS